MRMFFSPDAWACILVVSISIDAIVALIERQRLGRD